MPVLTRGRNHSAVNPVTRLFDVSIIYKDMRGFIPEKNRTVVNTVRNLSARKAHVRFMSEYTPESNLKKNPLVANTAFRFFHDEVKLKKTRVFLKMVFFKY